MCGIIAILSKLNEFNNTSIKDLTLNSLNTLLNRGYDSVGISFINNSKIYSFKNTFTQNKSAIQNLQDSIYQYESNTTSLSFNLSIGHSRWATHGARTNENAHPHNSFFENFSLVHNGIIQNYNELKEFLKNNNFQFKSQTDTEVIVNLIEYFYLFDSESKNNTYLSIQKTIQQLEGTYGLAIINVNEPNKLYCVRNGSPLLVGINENIAMVTSEQSGFCNLINNYITLENDDICVIQLNDEKNKNLKMNTNSNYELKNVTKNIFQLTPDPFPHWTIKEIYDQTNSILNAFNNGGRILNQNEVKLGGLDKFKEQLKDIKNLFIFGMGTSYHAGLLSTHYFENLCNFDNVQVFDAGEFHERKLINNNKKTAAIFISQSGETKDLHHILTIIKKYDILTIGVVNVVDSLIAREVDCGVYTNAGREVAVASTKVFTNQVIVLSLIAIWFSQNQNIHQQIRTNMIKDLQKLSHQFENSIFDLNDKMFELSKNFNFDNLFIFIF